MRARNIKPGFFKDEDLVECSIPARLLATGLWMLADREGRLMDKPKQIKMEIFPADNIDVEQLLSELDTHKHIQRYEISGVKYIQIRGFNKHQSPHFTEKPSLIPAPNCDDFQKITPSSQDITKALPPDSLIPDSLIALTTFEGDFRETKSPPELPDKKIREKTARGSRLPADWELDTEWGEWAESLGMTMAQIILEADKFKDYWVALPGPKATKTNWEATWRNWIRRCLEGNKK